MTSHQKGMGRITVRRSRDRRIRAAE